MTTMTTMEVVKHVMSRMGHLFEDTCKLIVRPERAVYTPSDLGPTVFRLSEDDPLRYHRVDMELENMRGQKLHCSWFRRLDPPTPDPTPCVVYLHGNCGSRLDALEILPVLQQGMSLFAYDASGSGLSEGEYVSLGFYERQDLASVVEFLHASHQVSTIGLWGRSMGAVTSIMYAARDDSIACVVGDSPFANLRDLCGDLVQQHARWVPNTVVSAVVNKMRGRIIRMVGFDIDDLDTVSHGARSTVPAFLFHGEDDDFVLPKHSLRVANSYAGPCLHRIVKGGHNSYRGDDLDSIVIPFLRLYLIEKPQEIARCAKVKRAAVPEAPAESPNNSAGATAEDRDGEENENEEDVSSTAPQEPEVAR